MNAEVGWKGGNTVMESHYEEVSVELHHQLYGMGEGLERGKCIVRRKNGVCSWMWV